MSRRVRVVGALAAVGVVVAWWVLVYAPLGDDLTTEEDRLAQLESEEAELRTTIARLELLQADGPAIDAELARLSGFVPETPDLAAFIVAADELGVRSGIDWLSIAPSPPSAPPTAGPTQIQMSIQIEGGFYQVLDYLNRLEELGRLVVVDAVSLNAGGESGDDPAGAPAGAPGLAVTLTARMFTDAPPEGTAPVAPAPTPDAEDGTAPTAPAGVTPGATGEEAPPASEAAPPAPDAAS